MRYLFKPDRYAQQRQNEKPVDIYPVLMAMEATYLRERGHDVDWNNGGGFYDEIVTKPKGIDFLSLPRPDRVWTNAFDKRYQVYGNYKYHPATHMQVADGCWHGKCSFCVENGREYKIRNINDVLFEIKVCEYLGFREIFDDSGTFPDGCWLDEFCRKKIKYAMNTIFGCNMRIGANANFELMKRAGFRMVLFGVESASQKTLDRIKKGIKADEIIPTIRRAAKAGLEPHIAVMFGQPGEGEEEERETLALVHHLLRKGYAKTAQASVFTVDGKRGVDRGNKNKIYNAGFWPDFWINRIRDIRSLEDFTYTLKGIRKALIHD